MVVCNASLVLDVESSIFGQPVGMSKAICIVIIGGSSGVDSWRSSHLFCRQSTHHPTRRLYVFAE